MWFAGSFGEENGKKFLYLLWEIPELVVKVRVGELGFWLGIVGIDDCDWGGWRAMVSYR